MEKQTNTGGQSKDKKQPELRFVVEEITTLMPFLLEKLPSKNRHNIKGLLRDKQVLVDGRATSQFNHLLKPEQVVEIRWTKSYQKQDYKDLTILFEDEHLVVIDKADGLLSIATEKQKLHTAYSILSSHIKKANPANRIFVVHRLDRETSGIMMFAKSEKVQKLLQDLWHSTAKERVYLAVTEGPVDPPQGEIRSYLAENKALIVYSTQNPDKGQLAVTHYETLHRNDLYSLLKVELETGRKNQIRVHLKDLGHPIIGDKKYGATTNPIGRVGLHAWVLAFKHPVTNEELRFKTPIPAKFQRLFS
ncbi:MAG: RluA family pseudouridine synthase [Spirosomataceae bacterium]